MTTKDHILSKLKASKNNFDKFGVTTVGLFGSYLRNEQTPASDIDILIDFEKGKETFENFMAVYDYMETLFPSEKIEIVTKKGLSKHIGPSILNSVVYA